DWNELKEFSQKQRELVLKISGFSERAWGSRGVFIAPDLPRHIWAEQIDKALAAFSTNPFILQRFYRGGLFEQKYLDVQTGEIRVLRGRVRLCPYYFVVSPREVVLGGRFGDDCSARQKDRARDARRYHGARGGSASVRSIAYVIS